MIRINRDRDDVVISYDLFRVDEKEETESTEDLDEVIGAVKGLVGLDQLTPREADKITEIAKKVFTTGNELVKASIQRDNQNKRKIVVVEGFINLFERARKSSSSLSDIVEFDKRIRKAKDGRQALVRDFESAQKPIPKAKDVIVSLWVSAQMDLSRDASVSLRAKKFVEFSESYLQKLQPALKGFQEENNKRQLELDEAESALKESETLLAKSLGL